MEDRIGPPFQVRSIYRKKFTLPESLTLKITSVNSNIPGRNVYLASDSLAGSSEYTFHGLVEDAVYTFTAILQDAAGNKNTYYFPVPDSSGNIPDSIVINWEEGINGFKLWGEYTRKSDNTVVLGDTYLNIPEELEIYKEDVFSGKPEFIKLQNIVLNKNQIFDGESFSSGSTDTGKYKIVFNSQTIITDTLSFSRDFGFYTGSSTTYEHEYYDRDTGTFQKEDLSFSAVKLGRPGAVKYSGFSAPLGSNTYSVVVKNDSGLDVVLLDLSEINQIELNGNLEILKGSPEFDATAFEALGITLKHGNDFIIPVLSASAFYQLRDSSLLLDSGVSLTLKGNSYLITDGEIRGRYLYIYNAELPVDFGDIQSINLSNFSVDLLTGKIAECVDFSSDTLSYTNANGDVYTFSGFTFSEDGTLTGYGTVTNPAWNGSEYTFTSLPIQNGEADWETGSTVNISNFMFSGFSFTAEKGYLRTDGLLFPEAKFVFREEDYTVKNLGMSRDYASVWQTGQGIGSHDITDLGYGATITVSSFSVTNEGVKGDFSVPVRAGRFPDTGELLLLNGVQLKYNGDMVYSNAEFNAVIELSGFSGISNGLDFDGKVLTIQDVTLIAPEGMSPGEINFKSVKIDYDGIKEQVESEVPEAGKVNYTYTFSGWKAQFEKIVLDNEGLRGKAHIPIPEGFGYNRDQFFTVSDFLIKDVDGEKLVNAVLDNGSIINLKGFFIKLPGAMFVKEATVYKLSCERPEYDLENIEELTDRTLYFGETVFASNGKISSGTAGTIAKEFLSSNGYNVKAASYTLSDKGIVMGGQMAPQWWETPELPDFPDGKILLRWDGTTSSEEKITSHNYSFAGWNIAGEEIEMLSSKVVIGKNTINYNGVVIELGKMVYSVSGILHETVYLDKQYNLDLFGGGVSIVNGQFDEDGLICQGAVTLPAELGTPVIFFDNIYFYQDGSYKFDSAIYQYTFDLQGINFYFRDIYLSQSGLNLGYMQVTLPEGLDSEGGRKQFKVKGLSIKEDGSFSLESASFDPFELWDMWFCLEDLSINDGIIDFGGYIYLPESAPGQLSRRKVAIKEFKISTAGEILSFDIRLDGKYTIPFLEGWSLTVEDFGGRYEEANGTDKGGPCIVFNKAILRFPPGYYVSNAEIEGVSFNLLTKKFRLAQGEVELKDCSFFNSGMTFTLDKLKFGFHETTGEISTLGFGGSVTLPSDDSMPEFLRSKIIKISTLNFHTNGTIAEIDISADNLTGKLNDMLTLQNGLLNIFQQNNDLLIKIGGEFVFNEKAPEGISGKTIQIGTVDTEGIVNGPGFVYNVAENKILVLAAQTKKDDEFDPKIFGVDFNDVGVKIVWDVDNQVATYGVWGGVYNEP